MFGSCLALTRDAHAGIRLFEGGHHTPDGAQQSDGVDFRAWVLRGGRLVKTDDMLQIRFPDVGNVHRFSVAGHRGG